MTTKTIRVHDTYGTYYVRVEVDQQKRKLKRIALGLLGAAALGLAAIATGYAQGPPVHTPKPPAGTGIGAGAGIVVDSAGHTIGQVMSPLAMVVLFKTNGLWFAPCYTVDGFTVDPLSYWATPNCSGTPYQPDVSDQPAILCGQMAIGQNGGSITYPDISKAADVSIQSFGNLGPDGSVDCFGPHFDTFPADPMTTIQIPTFTPPFKLQ